MKRAPNEPRSSLGSYRNRGAESSPLFHSPVRAGQQRPAIFLNKNAALGGRSYLLSRPSPEGSGNVRKLTHSLAHYVTRRFKSPVTKWYSSDRRKRLPPDWRHRRLRVLRRDRWRCQLKSFGCLEEATEVDHIVRGDNHSEDNLQAVCSACHKKKTQTESEEASAAKRARRYTPLLRMLETIECC